MGGQRLTDDSPLARDEVENACRQPYLIDDLGQHEGVEWRDLAGLEDHGASRRQRRGDLERNLVQGIVPGRDRPHHPHRLTHHQRIADLLLELVIARQLGVVAEHKGRGAELEQGHEAGRHANLGRHQAGQVGAASSEPILDLLQVGGAFRDRCRAPGGEGLPGRRDRPLGVGDGSFRDAADHLIGGGVDHLGAGLAVGRDPLAADIDPVAVPGTDDGLS